MDLKLNITTLIIYLTIVVTYAYADDEYYLKSIDDKGKISFTLTIPAVPVMIIEKPVYVLDKVMVKQMVIEKQIEQKSDIKVEDKENKWYWWTHLWIPLLLIIGLPLSS